MSQKQINKRQTHQQIKNLATTKNRQNSRGGERERKRGGGTLSIGKWSPLQKERQEELKQNKHELP